jgi:hypothetical protein
MLGEQRPWQTLAAPPEKLEALRSCARLSRIRAVHLHRQNRVEEAATLSEPSLMLEFRHEARCAACSSPAKRQSVVQF